MIQMDLSKETQAPISFGLCKIENFIVELYWESKDDLDAHAIALVGGKLTDVQSALSTYNNQLVLVEDNTVNHRRGGKKPFQNKNGSLVHQGDRQTGIQLNANAPDETITVNTNLLPVEQDEVAFFITSHPPQTVKFRDVNDARIVIKDDTGTIHLVANLTSDFDQYDIVQMGSLVLDKSTSEWKFNPVAQGLNGGFNDILAVLQ